MAEISTIPDLIDLWPSRRELADDCSTAEDAVTVDRVHKWAKAHSIPAKYHLRIVQASARRGFPVTAMCLARLHDRGGEVAA